MWAALAALALAGCAPEPGRVTTEGHDRFWLWAGVEAPDALAEAKEVYVLDGEIRRAEAGRYHVLRPSPPRARGPDLWLVVRTDTLEWPEGTIGVVERRLASWRASGGRVVGLQVDFDAATRELGGYAQFLARLRAALPPGTRLSVTGLMDWSANGDPATLAALRGTVDEVVIQTYQGRSTIPGYERYFARMKGFPIPFKVGVVERGQFDLPPAIAAEPAYRGTVVFLLP